MRPSLRSEDVAAQPPHSDARGSDPGLRQDARSNDVGCRHHGLFHLRYTSPTLCIGKDRAMGLCLRGGDPRGHHVGDCVTIRYTGSVDAPKSQLIVGPADPHKHPGDCPAVSR